MKGFLRRTARFIWEKRLFILVCGGGFAFFALSGIGCPIYFMTGVPCPACGITRAVWAAVCGNFSEAFYYHPLFPVIIPSIIYMLLGKQPLLGTKRRMYVFLSAFMLLLVGAWVFRLFFCENSAVYIDIEGSFMVKLWHKLFS